MTSVSVWLPATLKPAAARLKLRLAAVHRDEAPADWTPQTEATFWANGHADAAACRTLGYRRIEAPRRGRKPVPENAAAVAVRVDALERLAGALHKLRPAGPFTPTGTLAQLLGGDREALAIVLPALGYPRARSAEVASFQPRQAGGRSDKKRRGASAKAKSAKPAARANAKSRPRRPEPGGSRPDPDHPFAKLRELTFSK